MPTNYNRYFHDGFMDLHRKPSQAGDSGELSSTGISIDKECLGSVNVGDIVFINDADIVESNTDNLEQNLSIGVCIEKISANLAKILTYGYYEFVNPSNSPDRRVWLGTDGKFAYDRPTTGYLQPLGYVIDETKILINPSTTRAKLRLP